MQGKLVLIGAGIGMFSLNLVRDICLTKNLENFEICLMDIISCFAISRRKL